MSPLDPSAPMAVPSDERDTLKEPETRTQAGAAAASEDLDGAQATADTQDLLARFRDGDQEAFTAIVGDYEARLVRFFYRLCWDRDRAEDFTQDLFSKLLRGARRYQAQGRLSTFLFRVATNLWIDFYRSSKPKGRLYSLDQVMLTGEPDIKTDKVAATPQDGVLLEEEKQQLRGAILQLTEPHRLVLELAIYQEMPYAQISKVLDIPVGTVKSRMHNCVRALRACMAEHEEAAADRASASFPQPRAGGSAG